MKNLIKTILFAGASLLASVAVAQAATITIPTASVTTDTVSSNNALIAWEMTGEITSSSLSSWALTFTVSSTSSSSSVGVPIISVSTYSSAAAGIRVGSYVSDKTTYLILGDNNGFNTSYTLAYDSSHTYVLAYDAGSFYLADQTANTYIVRTYDNPSSVTSTLSTTSSRQWSNGGKEVSTVSTVADISSITGNSTAIVSYITTGVVPEPSTFGLLAGLGALALVAARRRRSRKAA